MSFFNDAQKDALLTGRYICSKCGARMQFEDEWEDILVCLECGHSVELERYGMEDDEEYEALYPTREEVAENLTKIISKKGEGPDEGSFSFLFGDAYEIPF